MDIKDIYRLYIKHSSVKTDTRKLQEGDFYFSLKGLNFNGNHFAKQALDAGAAYAVVDEDVSFTDKRLIKTDDALQTLQQLAKFHREQFSIPFIAITGSNGKTTTKELVHQVLSSAFRTYTTEGNLNNHIGVPLTILKIKQDAQVAVIEMGANHLKEIERYCLIAKPTHGLITNCGKAHLEGFGSVEGIKKGKGELFDYLRENNGTAFVNTDDIAVKELSTGIKNIITYGTSHASVTGKISKATSFLEAEITNENITSTIQTQLIGSYNLSNLLAAVAIGNYFAVPAEKIKSAIENYSPNNSRSQLIQKDSNRIILDAYNANPGSMKAAIENFAEMEGDNKILMLGSMMELGDESEKEHKAIINLIDQFKWRKVLLVGENFKEMGKAYFHFENALQLKDWFKEQHINNSQILIKGSRSMQMERVLD